ncbi:MAG: TlpA family protein disulfide reductase [Pseudomonadota bacterium]
MRKLLTGVLLLALVGCAPPPDFFDINGVGHRYADLQDKWIVVNYWATWCAPCIKEIPELNALAEDHAGTLVVLGVNFDQPEGEKALADARKLKIAFPVYAEDPHERLGVEKPEVLPTTFVFAPGLDLRATLVGPQTEASLLEVMQLD